MPSAATGPPTLRALTSGDGPAVRALAMPEIDRSPYRAGAQSALDTAIGGASRESRGIVALGDARLVGVAVYGEIAGASGAGRLQLIVVDRDVRRRGIATRLVERCVGGLAADGIRFVAIELPDDPGLSGSLELLLGCGFRVEATVADYFRDGIGLAILRRELETD
jgi:ribosomal protein S18 acetylase RimI-like enzyme